MTLPIPIVRVNQNTARLRGTDRMFQLSGDDVKKLYTDLMAMYKPAIADIADQMAIDARVNLGKPAWELSKAIIAKRIKMLKSGQIIFTAIEASREKESPFNTPGNYAVYHEYGYHTGNKSKPKSGNYRQRQEGKMFFQRAYKAHYGELKKAIDKVNEEFCRDFEERVTGDKS